MKVWVDRKGKAVEGKEFMERWKQGIQMVSPLQTIKVSLFGYIIVFLGIIWGMVLTAWTKQWWLLTILSGSFIITGSQVSGVIQKLVMLMNIERGFNDG